ncbi:MAG: LamG domain-containing protein, partial [Phycisphaerales bacterium]
VSEFTLDGRVPLDEEILYTWVHDDIAGTYKLYLNGIVQNGRATNVTLKEFNDINVWLGRGQWNDPLFVGSFNECRIYDTVLSAEEIALSYLAGPDELPVLAAPCDVDIAGDLNNDCAMDIVDAAILADQFLTQTLEAD